MVAKGCWDGWVAKKSIIRHECTWEARGINTWGHDEGKSVKMVLQCARPVNAYKEKWIFWGGVGGKRNWLEEARKDVWLKFKDLLSFSCMGVFPLVWFMLCIDGHIICLCCSPPRRVS